MRPLPPKQNPTSFLRKWPREKRRQRGPDEYYKIIHIRDYDHYSPRELGDAVRREAAAHARPGWNFTILEDAARRSFDRTFIVRVYYYRGDRKPKPPPEFTPYQVRAVGLKPLTSW